LYIYLQNIWNVGFRTGIGPGTDIQQALVIADLDVSFSGTFPYT